MRPVHKVHVVYLVVQGHLVKPVQPDLAENLVLAATRVTKVTLVLLEWMVQWVHPDLRARLEKRVNVVNLVFLANVANLVVVEKMVNADLKDQMADQVPWVNVDQLDHVVLVASPVIQVPWE